MHKFHRIISAKKIFFHVRFWIEMLSIGSITTSSSFRLELYNMQDSVIVFFFENPKNFKKPNFEIFYENVSFYENDSSVKFLRKCQNIPFSKKISFSPSSNLEKVSGHVDGMGRVSLLTPTP